MSIACTFNIVGKRYGSCLYGRFRLFLPPLEVVTRSRWQKGQPNTQALFHTCPTYQNSSREKNKRMNMVEKYIKGRSRDEMVKVYDVWYGMSLRELAQALEVGTKDVVEALSTPQFAKVITDRDKPIRSAAVFREVAKNLRCNFRYVPSPNKKKERDLDVERVPIDETNLVSRPPVVTLVGHVDHGKTTLLDYLRKSSIVASESGGITQHIGVFSVALNGQRVTFLDTPGHGAFKSMRQRGTNVTDIVVLLVDAVEGPLEQTFESLRAIRNSRVKYIVAINKIDRSGADVELVKQLLRDKADVQLEEFGGDVPCLPISALRGTNIDDLIETVLAQAEVLQLVGDPKGPVEGSVVESSVEKGLGKSTTVLVRRGTLTKNQFLVAGTTYARVKMLLNTTPALTKEAAVRTEIRSAGPSEGCKVYGWKELPATGSQVLQVANEKRAKEVVAWRKQQEESLKQGVDKDVIDRKRASDREEYVDLRMKKLSIGRMKLKYGRSDFYLRHKEFVETDERPKLAIYVKTDFDGTRDAIERCLESYSDPRVTLDVVEVSVGDVSQSDLQMVEDLNGIIYTFNAGISDALRKTASTLQVPIREFKVIYRMFEDIKIELNNKLPPENYDCQVGKGTVLEEFLINEKRKKVSVAGALVNQGTLEKDKMFKLDRNGVTIYRGNLASLRSFRDEVRSVAQGQECGLRFQDDSLRFLSGDIVVCYTVKQRYGNIEWDLGF